MSANLINFVTHITSGFFARVVRRRKIDKFPIQHHGNDEPNKQ